MLLAKADYVKNWRWCWLYNRFLLTSLGDGKQMPVHYGSAKHNFVTISSPLTTQLPQAVGSAYAYKRYSLVKVLVIFFAKIFYFLVFFSLYLSFSVLISIFQNFTYCLLSFSGKYTQKNVQFSKYLQQRCLWFTSKYGIKMKCFM